MLVRGSRDYIRIYEDLLNRTEHEKFVVEEIKRFSKAEWFRRQKATFGKMTTVQFSETLTKRGSAFTFNALEFDDLMNKQT